MFTKTKAFATALLLLVAFGYFFLTPDARAQQVTIELEPDYIEAEVGDTVCGTVTIQNHHWWFVTITGYAELTLPNGRIIHRDAPLSVSLPPFFTISEEICFEITDQFRPGTYLLTVCVTRTNGQVLDCDTSTMVVLPGAKVTGNLTDVEFKGFLF